MSISRLPMIFPFFVEERREPPPRWVGFHLSEVQDLADELASYDRDFETAKIWVGKQARHSVGKHGGIWLGKGSWPT